ncbi:hypothetical protein TH53_26365 [Pedobacter lusitanus]|uniref:Uncharacterized protein n=1 Tax=Pedobacter lusitanus TaxID=1503925 RepID=A0A0D0GE63_9SPHI|nr:hypothetical protein TH53_26365 [Pedobacter lusitanus]
MFFGTTVCAAQEGMKNYVLYTGVAKVKGEELLVIRKMLERRGVVLSGRMVYVCYLFTSCWQRSMKVTFYPLQLFFPFP